jgi:transposase
MFIRKKVSKRNPNTYIQLVESFRVNGKVNQRVVKHIGTAFNALQQEQLISLAEELKGLYNQGVSERDIDIHLQQELSKIQGSKSDILNCVEIKRRVLGIHEIYGKIFEEIGLHELIGGKNKYNEILCDLVMAKIAVPSSKRKAVETLAERFNIEIPLNSIYRMMDKIDESFINVLQDKVAKYNSALLEGEIKVLFYDATTLYFESFSEDELKKLGYSKDCKFNQPQVILTLLVTEEGLPLGYQVFPGNTYEGHTLISAMEYWKTKFPAVNFVLVADSGMLNNINLENLEQKQINYIVCARIKSLPKTTKDKVLAFKDTTSESDCYSELKFKSRRLIVSYKRSRASRDYYNREKTVKKLKDKLKKSKHPSSLISNYGYKKYICVEANNAISLNDSKIENDAHWDGLHGVITNLNDSTPEEIYKKYSGLWQIEDAFRVNKSDLKIRPIFHWTPARVQAHIAISYMAYSCYKAVQFKVNKAGLNLSHRKIKEHLLNVTGGYFEDQFSKEVFFVPSSISDEAIAIYKSMNQIPKNRSYCCTLELKA